MPNAALLLHDLLSRWIIPSTTSGVENHRTQYLADNAPHIEFWKMQAIAMGYLVEVEQALDFLEANDEDVAHYRDLLPTWFDAIVHPRTDWRSQIGTTRQLQPLELVPLKTLAAHLRVIGYVNSLDAGEVALLRASLGNLEEQVRQSSSIPADSRAYILNLIRECRAVLDDLGIYGEARYRSVSLELGGAITATAEAVEAGGDGAGAARLREAVKKFLSDLLRTYAKTQGLEMLETAGSSLKNVALEMGPSED
jgi:hypothetical protein